MTQVYLLLNWFFGGLFLLAALFSIIESPLFALCLIPISFLLLPPVRKLIYSKTNKELSSNIRVLLVIALLSVSGMVSQYEDRLQEQELLAKKAQEEAVEEFEARQRNIEYFNENREQILARANSALLNNEYKSAIAQTAKYMVSGDKSLIKINFRAKKGALLDELSTVPESDYERNKSLYQRLSNLNPSNSEYKDMLAHYSDKIEDAKQAEEATTARKKRIEQQFSGWDGAHRNLERFIKKAMHDPDSYDHDETVYWDMGDHLVVRTTYRGKNGFGGLVRNDVKAKVSLDGEILKIFK